MPSIVSKVTKHICQPACLPRINNFRQCKKLPVPFRRLKVTNRCVEFVAAPRVAEPHDVSIVRSQRIGLYRLPGPRAGLVDTVGDVEVVPSIRLVRNRFWVVQISVPPCVFYMYL